MRNEFETPGCAMSCASEAKMADIFSRGVKFSETCKKIRKTYVKLKCKDKQINAPFELTLEFIF